MAGFSQPLVEFALLPFLGVRNLSTTTSRSSRAWPEPQIRMLFESDSSLRAERARAGESSRFRVNVEVGIPKSISTSIDSFGVFWWDHRRRPIVARLAVSPEEGP